MTLELWNTFATFGTFIVIAATAIAALVQLRHARGSNQIAAMGELQDAAQTSEFVMAENWVATQMAGKLEDAEFRFQVVNRSARTPENDALISNSNKIGNYYEQVGVLVKNGLVDKDIALDLWAENAPFYWDLLAPITAMVRERFGASLWENFEYFVVLSQDWLSAHPTGAYPVGVRRIDLKNKWLEADREYAVSRAPA